MEQNDMTGGYQQDQMSQPTAPMRPASQTMPESAHGHPLPVGLMVTAAIAVLVIAAAALFWGAGSPSGGQDTVQQQPAASISAQADVAAQELDAMPDNLDAELNQIGAELAK